METVPLIILSVLGLAVLSVFIYFIIRFLKGSIKINMPINSFSYGENITGTFVLKTKKQIEGNRLYVSLIGKEKRTTYSGTQRSTHYEEICRFDQNIEGARSYSGGYRQTYSFNLPFPTVSTPQQVNSQLGQVVTAVGMFANIGTRSIVWEVKVVLDAKGVDLSKSKKIYLNFTQQTGNPQQSQATIQN